MALLVFLLIFTNTLLMLCGNGQPNEKVQHQQKGPLFNQPYGPLCYDVYDKCLTKGDERLIDPYMVDRDTLSEFCEQHENHVISCLSTGTNRQTNNGTILLQLCAIEMKLNGTGHQYETMLYAMRIFNYLCSHRRLDEILKDGLCFRRKMISCVHELQLEHCMGKSCQHANHYNSFPQKTTTHMSILANDDDPPNNLNAATNIERKWNMLLTTQVITLLFKRYIH